MADAVLSFAVESIGKLLIEEANFLQGVGDQVNELHDDLKWMEWFLKDADKKQSVRERVQPWISEFEGIAYEANDLVEDFEFRVASRNKGGVTNTLTRYACVFCESHTHHSLGNKIQSLRNRISKLNRSFHDYGVPTIIDGDGSSSRKQQLRRTYSFSFEDDFVGLESDVNLLVKYMVNEDGFGNKSVVSIYGMGGIGKTALARKVYHHPRVRQQFDGFAWFCISPEWSTKEILQGILIKLVQKQQIMDSKEDWLVKQLYQVMQSRRCLTILDDIWSKEAWDHIKPAFCISENGSKILLTTRNIDVAEHVDPNGYHHETRFLTEEESWALLKKKSLTNRSVQDDEDYHKLEELGKKMMKYCGGLPLAMVVLGGILKTKKSPKDWSIVHDNVKTYVNRGENIGQAEGAVCQILAFSYYDLPHQLRPCFLLLGKFKEDSYIEVERLYQLWIAEDMVLANDRTGQETMMDVAERYLEELAKRCMVQVQLHEEWQPTITRFKSCRLHNLMRDLCLDKAKEKNLYKVVDLSFENIGVPPAIFQLPSSSDMKPSSISKLKGKKTDKSRQVWTAREEAVLISALKELCITGWKCDNGMFRSGYTVVLEKAMLRVFPSTDLKATPHIESKINMWKKNYDTLASMLGKSSFGWNYADHMITVDSDDVWKNYVKIDPDAKSMRFKSWPYYDDWVEIFGKDRAGGQHAEGINDDPNVIEKEKDDVQSNYVEGLEDINDIFDEQNQPIPSSSNQVKDGNKDRAKKIKSRFEDENSGLVTVAEALVKFTEKTEARLGMISERIGYEHDMSSALREVYATLIPMTWLSKQEKLRVASRIMSDHQSLDLFFSLPDEDKPDMVQMILDGSI